MGIRGASFRGWTRWAAAPLLALAMSGPARAQLAPVDASVVVGQPSAISVTIPLQVTMATLAARYGSTVVYNTADPTQVLAFSLIGISMPVTVQKIYAAFPTSAITVNGFSLSLTGDPRFSLSAGTCAAPSGNSCRATASYNGQGPAGTVTVRVKATVSSINVTGAGLTGAMVTAISPLLAGAVSGYLYVDLRVAIAAADIDDPDNHTALWWNPDESGWGLNVNHQGRLVFATLFTYDNAGQPLWLVMSAGAQQPGTTTYQGPLYRTSGPAFNSVPFTPIGPSNVTEVGRMSIAFSGRDAATLTYTVNGIGVTKAIRRQQFGSRLAECTATTGSRDVARNYQDLWWNPGESGWGLNVTQQDDVVFATLFTYAANGQGLWLVMSGGRRQPDGTFAGDLYRTTGPSFDATPFTPIGPANVSKVGTLGLAFTDGGHGTLTYSVDGVVVTKSIERQVFASPLPSCS